MKMHMVELGMSRLYPAQLNSVQRLIYQMVWKYQRRYGGDFNELMSTAHEAFMNAVHTWIPSKGKLTTWVGNAVHWQLRNSYRDNKRPEFSDVDLTTIAKESQFDFTAFASELSDDARAICQLIVENAPELEGTFHKRFALSRVALSLGWPLKRIMNSFQEIREALA